MAKVSEIVALTLTPISWAAPRSSDTANMAWPAGVLLTNQISTTMMTMQAMMVTTVSAEMVSCPPNRLMGLSPETTEVKLLGLDVQASWATCCKR